MVLNRLEPGLVPDYKASASNLRPAELGPVIHQNLKDMSNKLEHKGQEAWATTRILQRS